MQYAVQGPERRRLEKKPAIYITTTRPRGPKLLQGIPWMGEQAQLGKGSVKNFRWFKAKKFANLFLNPPKKPKMHNLYKTVFETLRGGLSMLLYTYLRYIDLREQIINKSVFKITGNKIITARKGRNIFGMSVCERLWHWTCNIFVFLKLSKKGISDESAGKARKCKF